MGMPLCTTYRGNADDAGRVRSNGDVMTYAPTPSSSSRRSVATVFHAASGASRSSVGIDSWFGRFGFHNTADTARSRKSASVNDIA